jgi:hypothetical protein
MTTSLDRIGDPCEVSGEMGARTHRPHRSPGRLTRSVHHNSATADKAASDGTINDFGAVHSIFFRDPDGLEGEVVIAKVST